MLHGQLFSHIFTFTWQVGHSNLVHSVKKQHGCLKDGKMKLWCVFRGMAGVRQARGPAGKAAEEPLGLLPGAAGHHGHGEGEVDEEGDGEGGEEEGHGGPAWGSGGSLLRPSSMWGRQASCTQVTAGILVHHRAGGGLERRK